MVTLFFSRHVNSSFFLVIVLYNFSVADTDVSRVFTAALLQVLEPDRYLEEEEEEEEEPNGGC